MNKLLIIFVLGITIFSASADFSHWTFTFSEDFTDERFDSLVVVKKGQDAVFNPIVFNLKDEKKTTWIKYSIWDTNYESIDVYYRTVPDNNNKTFNIPVETQPTDGDGKYNFDISANIP